MYLVHRIIWELHNGEIPDNLCVDHIDGNPLNNAIHNLRLVTRTVNGRNQKKFSTNRSGVTGVSWDEQNSRWLAQWKDRQGVAKKKSFSAKKYGYDEALEAAKLYREQIISTLNSEGAGYTQRHGT